MRIAKGRWLNPAKAVKQQNSSAEQIEGGQGQKEGQRAPGRGKNEANKQTCTRNPLFHCQKGMGALQPSTQHSELREKLHAEFSRQQRIDNREFPYELGTA